MLPQPWTAAQASLAAARRCHAPGSAACPRQHDVDLHEVVCTEGVRPHCVDVPDLLVVVPDQVHQLCQVLRRRRLANQRTHVVQYRTCPGSGHVQSNLRVTIHLLSFYLLEW
jgi:hypothetical protein